jgi:hypothetical protein
VPEAAYSAASRSAAKQERMPEAYNTAVRRPRSAGRVIGRWALGVDTRQPFIHPYAALAIAVS